MLNLVHWFELRLSAYQQLHKFCASLSFISKKGGYLLELRKDNIFYTLNLPVRDTILIGYSIQHKMRE